MERREKVELILEQMRLCLAVKDYIRAQIISKKVNVRFFESNEQQDLKLKFYDYMTQLVGAYWRIKIEKDWGFKILFFLS